MTVDDVVHVVASQTDDTRVYECYWKKVVPFPLKKTHRNKQSLWMSNYFLNWPKFKHDKTHIVLDFQFIIVYLFIFLMLFIYHII